MKKCFTINALRTYDDFLGFNELLESKDFSGIEIFYPYNVSIDQRKLYEKCLTTLTNNHPDVEAVLHLPHGGNNNLINSDYKPNKEIIKRMEEAFLFGVRYHAKKFTLHLGSAFSDLKCDRGILISEIVKVLKEFSSKAEEDNYYIMIENMPRDNELGYSPEEILSIIEAVNNEHLKFIMDTGHAHVSSYELSDYIDTLGEYLYHMHFSDNNGKSDEHKPIGEGTIDFVKLFTKLNEINYPELHCLEILFNDYHDLIRYANKIEEYNYLYQKKIEK